MNLNATVLADYLEGFTVLEKKTPRTYSFYLNSIFIWDQDSSIPKDLRSLSQRIVVCTKDCLPPEELLSVPRGLCIVCVGELPSDYRSKLAEYLIVGGPASCSQLATAISDVFGKINDWVYRLDEAVRISKPLHEIATIGNELFQNDFCLLDSPQRMLFRSHPQGISRLSSDEGIFAERENSYFPQIQIDAFFSNPNFRKTLKEKHPVISETGLLPFRTLMSNIFEEGVLIGQLTLDETYNDFKPSDFSLLYFFNNYARIILLGEVSFSIGFSKEFDAMASALVAGNSSWNDAFDKTLASRNWSKMDKYRCVVIKAPYGAMTEQQFSQLGFFFQMHFDEFGLLKHESHLIAIFNLSKSQNENCFIDRFLSLLSQVDFICGLSSSFCNFAKLSVFIKQATLAVSVGYRLKPDNRVFPFEKYALELLLNGSIQQLPTEALFTRPLATLIEYDKQKKADLLLTLKVYLKNNGNATKSYDELGIYKTTFYYRLNRIAEISGLDIDDYRTRLYLSIIFELAGDTLV